MINFEALKPIRLAELELALSSFPKTGRVLEIGAGAGWQAKYISQKGYEVSAIDVHNNSYEIEESYPIIKYDGFNIPFPDAYFDVVFSSNVLEHIPHVVEFQNEIRRVIKDNGTLIHLVPTTTWKFWATVLQYPMFFRMGFRWLIEKIGVKQPEKNKTYNNSLFMNEVNEKYKALGLFSLLLRVLPRKHGERGNYFTEYYYFTKKAWEKVFNPFFKIKKYSTNSLFYTGNGTLAPDTPIKKRQLWASWLGGACHVFVLSPKQTLKSKSDV